MPRIIFDSRDPRCKTPFGAIRTGEEARFTIQLPKRFGAVNPVLKVFEMDHWEVPVLVPMVFQRADILSNFYSCTFVSERPGLFAYYFDLITDTASHTVKRSLNGAAQLDDGGMWQLTVYDAAMACPSFLREGVIYQIFPDRFCFSGQQKEHVPADRTLRNDWGGIPVWRPNEEGEVTNSDYFQGDLRGITEKLDYLQSLGVTVLYLNPVFEAHSNHRYNTANYMKIDPLLGTNEEFRLLCEAAAEKGMAVLLDGVFSHTGSDSVYFNMEKRYGEGGAYNNPQSVYRPWYKFTDWPHGYESWWGFRTLPNVNEEDPSYLNFICGEQGVLRHWMNLGARGFRLDVADELPDIFLDCLHRSVKGHNPDSAVIGEVWEDASNKVSYGQRRRYLQGAQLDSVMNYPFQEALLDYIRHGNAERLLGTVFQVLENYPKPAVQCLMNFLSTHDTVRAITSLGGPPLEDHGRDWQETYHQLTEGEYRQGCRLFSLACILQYGLPGIPSIYYGDEAGLCGYKDPFNRVCYPWGNENKELIQLLTRLGAVRRDYPIFAEAEFVPLSFTHEICSFLRRGEDASILFAVNRSDQVRVFDLPQELNTGRVLLAFGEEFTGKRLGPYSGVVLLFRAGEEILPMDVEKSGG